VGRFLNLTGQRFGRLVALKQVGKNKQQNANWLCICDCGNTVTISQSNLHRASKGYNTSCGCLRRENSRKQLTTHGLSETRLYEIWCGMKKRCFSPTDQAYSNYGGRGITICDEWLVFERFYEWAMANGYQDHLTIERKDNNKGYSPGNCKWATMKEQANNTRRSHLITHNGQTMTVTAWAKSVGIKVNTLWARIKKGWPVERALERRNVV